MLWVRIMNNIRQRATEIVNTELELMDDSDRREALKNAGLDPDDYEF